MKATSTQPTIGLDIFSGWPALVTRPLTGTAVSLMPLEDREQAVIAAITRMAITAKGRVRRETMADS
jgi:hypothetical protein